MIQYSNHTIFNVESQTIVNTVNCVGVMGAGLALECKLRFPKMYQDYRSRCKQKTVQLGKPYIYKESDDCWIVNFPTKNHWKYPSKLEWIEKGLEYFVNSYQKEGITSIAFPKLGCDRGGLDWNDVKTLMEKYLNDLDIDIYICLDQESKACGIESLMVEMLNDTQEQVWIKQLNIKQHIVYVIYESLPLKRFRQLARIKGVGKKTYQDIFQFLYSQAIIKMKKKTNTLIAEEQLTLDLDI